MRRMSDTLELTFVSPVDDDPGYRGARALRHAVLRAPLGYPPGSEWFDFEPEALHLVARVGDAIVGCVIFHPDGRGGGRMCQMAITPERQGTGLGRRLVRHLEDHLRAAGVARVSGHARLHAAGFYAKLGYAVEGEPYDELGIPHVMMGRTL